MAALCCSAPRANAQAAQRAGSAYEQRWGNACREHAAVGKLDPPPGRRLTLVIAAEPDIAPPRVDHAHLDAETVRRLKDALLPRYAALKSCFAAVGYEAWVELALARPNAAKATTELPPDVVKCATALLRAALATTDPGAAEFISLRYDHPEGPPPSEQGGGLSRAHIRDVIQAQMGDVRACYVDAIRVWPKVSGRVDTRFVIAADGQVAFVEAMRSSVLRPALECCITSAIKRWRFDAPADGGVVIVRYPFVLRQVSSL